MKITKWKFLKICVNKWQKTSVRVAPGAAACDCCCPWPFWPFMREEDSIPNDVPKGHLVVYVGEDHRRFIIKTLLEHPLFKALLDEAREEYDFTADSKLCILCCSSVSSDAPPLDQIEGSLCACEKVHSQNS